MSILKSCIKSRQSSLTFSSVPPLCSPTTSVRNIVISKTVICHDSLIKCPHKCLGRSTIVKNRNAVKYVSEFVPNVYKVARVVNIKLVFTD